MKKNMYFVFTILISLMSVESFAWETNYKKMTRGGWCGAFRGNARIAYQRVSPALCGYKARYQMSRSGHCRAYYGAQRLSTEIVSPAKCGYKPRYQISRDGQCRAYYGGQRNSNEVVSMENCQ